MRSSRALWWDERGGKVLKFLGRKAQSGLGCRRIELNVKMALV